MSIFDDLIFDRTESDVSSAIDLNNKIAQNGISSLSPSELIEYESGLKGAYNHTDLNRVGEATQYIVDNYLSFGETIPAITKTDWVMGDIPSKEELYNYLDGIDKLRTRSNLTSPTIPTTMEKLNYESANAIEKILFLAYEDIKNKQFETHYTGMFYSGELG